MSKWIVPVLALLMLSFAVAYAVHSQQVPPIQPPPVVPATNPFGDVVAGTGFVEPANEASGHSMTSVGAERPGVVVNIPVHIGQIEQSGDVLLQLDCRTANADLKVREAAVKVAEATLDKLEQQPRTEEVPPLEAQVQANLAAHAAMVDIRERDRRLSKTKSITEQELFASEKAARAAEAQLAVSKANLALLKAGAWEADKAIARASLELARAQRDQALTNVRLLEVRAPVTGSVLQINIRCGEYVACSPSQSLIVMGNLEPYHVRVSIDEEDIPRLKLNGPARAVLRGDPQRREAPLTVVRIEPAVVPKTSLTGANTERVDTRVMQVIYSVDPQDPLVLEQKILVGQLLDVFIDVR